MPELGDPGPAGECDGPSQRLLADDQLDAVAEGVVEPDELPHPPRPARRRVPAGDGEPPLLQLGLGQCQRVLVGHREAGGDHPGLAPDQREAVVAVVGAQVCHAGLAAVDELEADDPRGEVHGRGQVGRAGADVGDVGQFDHASS